MIEIPKNCSYITWKETDLTLSLYELLKETVHPILIIPPERSEGGVRIFIIVCAKMAWRPVSICLSPQSPPTPLVLEGWNLAGVILIVMAQNLWTRFLKFCLEPEKINFKVMHRI